jgi:hypothetical protein
MTRLTSLVVLAAAIGLVIPPARGQNPKKLPTVAEVLAKLKEKRDRGGEQTYKLEFEWTGLNNGQPVGSCRSGYDEFRIDWATGRFHSVGWDGCVPKPYEIIRIYDGKMIKTQFRDVTADRKPIGDGTWKYGMMTGRRDSATFQAEYWPIFFHTGSIRTVSDLYYPGHFVFDPDPEKFFVDGEVTRGGQRCISLKTFPEHPIGQMRYEYLIDPGKDYAVVACVYSREKAVAFSLDITVEPAKQPGRWVPTKWAVAWYDGKGRINQVVQVKVTGFSESETAAADKYDIVPPEGARVGRTHTEFSEDKQETKDTHYQYEVQDGKLVQIAGPAPPLWDRVRENWHWFVLAGGLAAAALVGFRKRRGWRRGSVLPAPAKD